MNSKHELWSYYTGYLALTRMHDICTDNDATTKSFQLDGLPNFLSNVSNYCLKLIFNNEPSNTELQMRWIWAWHTQYLYFTCKFSTDFKEKEFYWIPQNSFLDIEAARVQLHANSHDIQYMLLAEANSDNFNIHVDYVLFVFQRVASSPKNLVTNIFRHRVSRYYLCFKI